MVTGAFGVRNFGHIPSGLAEAHRGAQARRPALGARAFASLLRRYFGNLYLFYFHKVLPLIGGLISGQRRAYAYLPRSVGTFPQDGPLSNCSSRPGLARRATPPMTLGIAAVYQGVKGPG